jgi:hypothetical protein
LSPPSLRPPALSIEQLEAGLLVLSGGEDEQKEFCEENVAAFRQTVLVAIKETSDALRLHEVPQPCRRELEEQVKALRRYAAMADRYIAEQRRWFGPSFASGRFPERSQ